MIMKTSSSSISSCRPPTLMKPNSNCDFRNPAKNGISPLALNLVLNSPGISYSRFGEDGAGGGSASAAAQEIGWDRGEFENKEKRPYMIRWKSGKKVDQRLMVLLETYFQEINYVRRQDFFKKLFPEMLAEFAGVFSNIDEMLTKNSGEVKSHTLQRSLSVRSPRRPQRFKVKKPAAVVVRDAWAQSGASTGCGK